MYFKEVIMPVCFDRKIAFIHIPKTAGQSIEDLFEFKCDNYHYAGDHHNGYDFSHCTIKNMQSKIDVSNFFKFSFVRNPFDRLVSEFFFRPKNGVFFKRLKMKKHSFDDFVNGVYQYKLSYDVNKSYDESHLYKQFDFIYIDNKISVDFLGRFENLKNDISTLKKKFNINKNIIHKNKTNHYHYSSYYSTTTKSMVEKIYEKDLNTFNYYFSKSKLYL
jgi:hypothetical protein